MKALKILGIIVLSLFLFFFLNVFALTLTIDRTALNPGFVTSQVDSLEMGAVAEEVFTQQPDEEVPDEMTESMIRVVNALEPRIKEQVNTVIFSSYEYINGERANPEMARVVRTNLLSEDFIEAVIDEIEIATLVSSIFEERMDEAAPEELKVFGDLAHTMEQAISQNEEMIKEQLKEASGDVADYIMGKTDSFSVEIDASPVLESMQGPMYDSFLETPPGYLEGEPAELIQQEFEEFFEQFSEELPVNIELNEEVVGADLPDQVAGLIGDMEYAMGEIRGASSVITLVLVLSGVFALLFAGLIVLIHRRAVGATLNLGIVFLLSGILALTAVLVGRNVVSAQIVREGEIPAEMAAWLGNLVSSAFTPLLITSIVYLAASLLLLVACIIFRQRQQA